MKEVCKIQSFQTRKAGRQDKTPEGAYAKQVRVSRSMVPHRDSCPLVCGKSKEERFPCPKVPWKSQQRETIRRAPDGTTASTAAAKQAGGSR